MTSSESESVMSEEIDNGLYIYDVTMKYEGFEDTAKVREDLRSIAKKWAFQIEKGEESGYVHYQIRLSLFKRKRVKEMEKLLFTIGWNNFRASPTSNNGKKLDFYVIKFDTRVDGPWTDKDPEPKYIQKRFRKAKLRDWQHDLLDELIKMKEKGNDRNIVMVEDEGGEGKSFFRSWAYSTREDVVYLPSTLTSANEMIEFICSCGLKSGWEGIILMDVPRATSMKHWWTLSAGLETLKQGIIHDKRYKAKVLIIEPPQICCFMNHKPPEGVMTSDVFIWYDKKKVKTSDLVDDEDELAACQEEEGRGKKRKIDSASADASAI